MAETVTNGLGMTLRRVEPGTVRMGARDDEADAWRVGRDERPRREVTVGDALYVAETPVTNAQYEAFDETHAADRGTRGLSTGDDEAAVMVSWRDAVAFCEWLSAETGDPYRLPTEAEWEYACRAGTTTPFHTGTDLPDACRRHQADDWHPTPVDLTVGETPANDWGLRDCHGLVEEWCRDWHGPYPDRPQTDPVGRADGVARVTRGGSHNTATTHLRSAARSAALPDDRNWFVGFRPVMGPEPSGDPLPSVAGERWREPSDGPDWTPPTPDGDPYFAGPTRFVPPVEEDAPGPPYSHNHCPAVTWTDAGDLLAVWFSCEDEADREMVLLGSRFRPGEGWDEPSVFFDVPDRNLTGSALFHDPDTGDLSHFNGVGAASHWANLAAMVRTSSDGGATWSAPEFVDPNHRYRNQVIAGTLKTEDGALVQPCDAVSTGSGGTAIHRSPDGGETWTDPGRGSPPARFEAGETGGTIAGIHAGVVELDDGRLLALGRGDTVDGQMPVSVSDDGGATWTYSASDLPPLDTGQRLVLTRLREGPLLLVSFTDPQGADDPSGMDLRTPGGDRARCRGLFAALSFDEGASWPVRRLVSPGDPPRELSGGAWTGSFTADETHGEPMGYLAATQTPDGVVHLLSSANHYRFDADWLTEYAER
jgi:formylglycine-generating enzyme required for sulfatase activity